MVAAMMAAFIFYRWWVVSRAGEYHVRTEWPFWLVAAAAVAVSIVITIAGRLAMLVLTPIILIPIGVLVLQRSASMRTVGGLDLRLGGMPGYRNWRAWWPRRCG